MKRKLPIISLLLILFTFQLSSQTSLTTAVDFTATDSHGQEISLFEILDSGKYVLIDFFFTTCGPCQQATPNIKEAYERLGCNQHEVFFIEISPSDNNSECNAWVNNYGIEYPTIGSDGGGGGICSQYNIQYYPSVILIAPDREIVIQDIWPIGSSDAIVNALAPFGIQEHDCGNTADCIPATNMAATTDGTNVTLTWNAPAVKSVVYNERANHANDFTYTISRNGTEIASNLTTTSYTDNNVPTGAHNYCVKVVYTDCESADACTDIVIADNCMPASNVTVEAVENEPSVKVSWFAPAPCKATETLLSENFDNGIPTTWQNIDNDGDGRAWFTETTELGYGTTFPEGMVGSMSAAFVDGWFVAFTPDNWLITPDISGATEVTYWVQSIANPGFDSEYYGVFVSSTGLEVRDFTSIHEENLHDNIGATLTQRTHTLPTGTKYVAWRHFNCTDQYVITLDDITVTKSDEQPAPYTYTVSRDGAEIASGLTTNSYIDSNIANGTYEYCVEVVYSHCTSEAACASPITVGINDVASESFTVYPNPAKDYIYVKGEVSALVLYNSLGQAVKATIDNGKIDVSSLSNGIYYLDISTSNATRRVEKVIIAK